MNRRSHCYAFVLALAAMAASPCAAPADVSAPPLTAAAALVMDGATGKVLWARNPDVELPMASTTKVMTALLALESDALRKTVAVTPVACGVGGTKLDFRPGQRFELEDLVYATLLNSANDASMAIAESVAGSIPAFAERMTERARQLGALHTRYANPSGLTADGHYSTVRDLATIFRYGLGVQKFREILTVPAIEIRVDGGLSRIALRSHNRLLGSYRVPILGKTGFTVPARKCFVGAGQYGGRALIVAVLGSTDLWGDTRRLLDFGFATNFPGEPILEYVKVTPPPFATRLATTRVPPRPHGYAIRVGMFDRLDAAQRLQHTLGRRGYDDVEIDTITALAGRRGAAGYSVNVGLYPDKRRAEAVGRAVQNQVAVPTAIVYR